jgi:hypothetical protein
VRWGGKGGRLAGLFVDWDGWGPEALKAWVRCGTNGALMLRVDACHAASSHDTTDRSRVDDHDNATTPHKPANTNSPVRRKRRRNEGRMYVVHQG